MKKTIFITLMAVIGLSMIGYAQKFLTKTGHIKFYSEAPLENIEAHNNQVNSAFDANSGNFVFKLLMKSFEFEKALMEEHFNENYVHSNEYPNATFVGKVTNLDEIDLEMEGEQKVKVKGDLSIHGKTNEIETDGVFITGNDMIKAHASFNILLEDYNVKIPSAVAQNISESVEITVNIELKKIESITKK